MTDPISNEIFETYRIRERAKEQVKAMNLLIAQGYTILDLEGNILNKETIKQDQHSYKNKRPRWDYRKEWKGNKEE
tara:strand:- start:710 stop:937 length:228 start_codon:yes stop_codon:yes gene_type:complete